MSSFTGEIIDCLYKDNTNTKGVYGGEGKKRGSASPRPVKGEA